jgi:hypothetical protein
MGNGTSYMVEVLEMKMYERHLALLKLRKNGSNLSQLM